MTIISEYTDKTFGTKRFIVRCPKCGREYAHDQKSLDYSKGRCPDMRCAMDAEVKR